MGMILINMTQAFFAAERKSWYGIFHRFAGRKRRISLRILCTIIMQENYSNARLGESTKPKLGH
jgi:hypothetical protein